MPLQGGFKTHLNVVKKNTAIYLKKNYSQYFNKANTKVELSLIRI